MLPSRLHPAPLRPEARARTAGRKRAAARGEAWDQPAGPTWVSWITTSKSWAGHITLDFDLVEQRARKLGIGVSMERLRELLQAAFAARSPTQIHDVSKQGFGEGVL